MRFFALYFFKNIVLVFSQSLLAVAVVGSKYGNEGTGITDDAV